MREPTQEEIDELLKVQPITQEPDLADLLWLYDSFIEQGIAKSFEMRISYGKLEVYDENGELCEAYKRKWIDLTPIKDKQ